MKFQLATILGFIMMMALAKELTAKGCGMNAPVAGEKRFRRKAPFGFGAGYSH